MDIFHLIKRGPGTPATSTWRRCNQLCATVLLGDFARTIPSFLPQRCSPRCSRMAMQPTHASTSQPNQPHRAVAVARTAASAALNFVTFSIMSVSSFVISAPPPFDDEQPHAVSSVKVQLFHRILAVDDPCAASLSTAASSSDTSFHATPKYPRDAWASAAASFSLYALSFRYATSSLLVWNPCSMSTAGAWCEPVHTAPELLARMGVERMAGATPPHLREWFLVAFIARPGEAVT